MTTDTLSPVGVDIFTPETQGQYLNNETYSPNLLADDWARELGGVDPEELFRNAECGSPRKADGAKVLLFKHVGDVTGHEVGILLDESIPGTTMVAMGEGEDVGFFDKMADLAERTYDNSVHNGGLTPKKAIEHAVGIVAELQATKEQREEAARAMRQVADNLYQAGIVKNFTQALGRQLAAEQPTQELPAITEAGFSQMDREGPEDTLLAALESGAKALRENLGVRDETSQRGVGQDLRDTKPLRPVENAPNQYQGPEAEDPLDRFQGKGGEKHTADKKDPNAEFWENSGEHDALRAKFKGMLGRIFGWRRDKVD